MTSIDTPPPSRRELAARRRAAAARRRRRLAIVLVAILAGLGLAGAGWYALGARETAASNGEVAAGRGSTGTTPRSTTTTLPRLGSPKPGYVANRFTAVGDSVLLDAEPPLRAALPGLDFAASEGEQWYTGMARLAELKAAGQLGEVVIVNLSTNGPISQASIDQLMEVASGATRVVITTAHVPRDWQDPNNAIIAQAAKDHPNVVVADWYALSTPHPEWFYGDGIHLPIGGIGATALAQLLADKAKG